MSTKLMDVNTERLTAMAAFLETVPPEDFTLSEWVRSEPRAPIVLGPITLRRGCGFSGCAMGWAAHSRIFSGFMLNRQQNPVYRGASGMKAVAKLFGIGESMGWYLFDDDSYKNIPEPADVSARMYRLVTIVERWRERSVPWSRQPVARALKAREETK